MPVIDISSNAGSAEKRTRLSHVGELEFQSQPSERSKLVGPENSFEIEDERLVSSVITNSVFPANVNQVLNGQVDAPNQINGGPSQRVNDNIRNIDLIFKPTPQQKPVSSGSFILEYNVSSQRKSKKDRLRPTNDDNMEGRDSSLVSSSYTNISLETTPTVATVEPKANKNLRFMPSLPFLDYGSTQSPTENSGLNSGLPSQNFSHTNSRVYANTITHMDTGIPNGHFIIQSRPSGRADSELGTPADQPTPKLGRGIDDEDIALSPPRFIPELSALDSLNRLLEEDTFLQDQQFIDDFIISEHAFSNPNPSNTNHQSYRNALLQVPARNIHNGSSYVSRALTAHTNRRLVESLLNGRKSNAGSTLTDDSVTTPSDTGTEESDGTSDIVTIPRGLTPLPDILIQVPVYRDLFYHFVDVTADALVPVPQLYNNNPFKIVLPRLALNTPHILSLIIAYAATHRAKILHQPEPVEMIGKLLERTFDGLTHSLENEREALSDTTLATAIMLSSYSIISSAAEESWKTHLHGAREIVVARGIASSLSGGILTGSQENIGSYTPAAIPNSNNKSYGPQPLRVIHEDVSNNEVISFLIRVFAYIDVIGALSSSSASSVLTNNEQVSQLWSIPNWNLSQQRHYSQDLYGKPISTSTPLGTLMNGDPDIDFLLGIDLNLIPVLSKVSSLAKRRRILEQNPHEFTLDAYNAENSDLLSEGLELSKILISCCSSGELRRKERIKQGSNLINQHEHTLLLQLATMNLTFGYSGLIHLYRRVLKLTTDSAPVQELVTMITDLLDQNIPIGSSIEACMSFPIFTTACEVTDPEVRDRYRERMNSMQRFGFGQVSRAQQLMEECWARNEPWTGIMDDLGWGLVLA
ncbi:putative RNA-binding protein C3H8.09c [Sugiyamaella lignohabitans]|uniref:Putative RNA-binding protein C3H8.09c n=1 Tax=Sugiyamaella lignohabitans TaxID=796027 RepID=A0A167FSB9_9ASCO|nr:putative RNA-binding protein C3H8.09c [Sugiyamaella lignohabitans]ANB15641.1 putative RNA-binding protein C3H8.09c [Sugiyamaella lignohabitans]